MTASNERIGCKRMRIAVMIPKLPPPPRRARNSSALCVASALTNWPLARTTLAPNRLSKARPYFPFNSIAAAERQARHADGAAIAGHGDEPMRGRGVDHVCGRGTASNNGRFCGYLDIDLPDGGQV